MEKVKHVLYLILSLLAAGCNSGYKTALIKTRAIVPANTICLPLVVDLNIDESRVSGSFSCKNIFGIEYAKTQAVAVVLKKSNADVLFEPHYLIESAGSFYNVEVSGHPAHYKNFRQPAVEEHMAINQPKLNAEQAEPPVVKYKPAAPAVAPQPHYAAAAAEETVKSEPVAAEEVEPVEPVKADEIKPEPVKETPEESSDIAFHRVTEGETVNSIVAQFGITVEDFKSWNYLPDGIKPGIDVVVKYGAPKKNIEVRKTASAAAITDSGVQYHVVATGETLYHISQVYHVTVQQIKDWNDLTSNTVSVGQNLVVAK